MSVKDKQTITQLKLTIVALRRSVRESGAQQRLDNKKSKKAEKFIGVAEDMARIIENLQDVKVANLCIADTRNINEALNTLIAAHAKVTK